jgi:hypothetical protein
MLNIKFKTNHEGYPKLKLFLKGKGCLCNVEMRGLSIFRIINVPCSKYGIRS